MDVLILCAVAFLGSGLTFFSGFGLGTLLLPVFAAFYPVPVAVACTAVVHFLNGLFKLALAGRHADRAVALRFGIPAVLAAAAGAWLLTRLAMTGPLATYTLGGSADGGGGLVATITPVNLVVGALLVLVSLIELHPRWQNVSLSPKLIPLGGLVSGFFGGVSGMQGAFRSAFLIRAGLSKEAFIGTGIVVAVFIDVTRLGVYGASLRSEWAQIDLEVVGAAVLSAFAGAYTGSRLLRKVTYRGLQLVVGAMLGVAGLAMALGLLA